jgi:DNA polymerase I-like protein with 3'-5' exonuclease and polymerase domains
MGYIDGEQAESRVVAYLSGDENYIRACEEGDLHTTVATMVWPEKSWSADQKENRVLANEIFYRNFSYRDLSKRGGHGTNYRGKARTMAMHLHVDTKLIEEFQARYFAAFPGIGRWHHTVAEELQTKGYLTTPLGRTRYFLNRLWDDDTLKEAIAFLPQSTIGEIINEGLYRVWRDLDAPGASNPDYVQCLAQIHDAILVQWPDIGDEHESHIISLLKSKMEVPIPINGRTLIIPANCEGTGWNWRKYDQERNPQGLKKWTGHDTRTQIKENTSLFSQIVL